MAYCEHCGKQLGENANFCRECGGKVNRNVQNSFAPIPASHQTDNVLTIKQMSLWQGFIAGWKNFAVCRGRARRAEYWGWTLFISLFAIAFSFLDFLLGLSGTFAVLSFLFSMAIVIPSITITIRRLHDTNRSGWHYFWWGVAPWIACIVLIIPLILSAFAGPYMFNLSFFDFGFEFPGNEWMGLMHNPFFLFSLILLSIALLLGMVGGIVLLVYTCQDSTPGENRFGPNPKESHQAANKPDKTKDLFMADDL